MHNCGMGDFAKDYAYGVDARADAELRAAGDLPGHPPSRRAGRDAQLYRHPDQRELQRACRRPGRRRLPRNPFTGDNPLADFPNVDGVVALTHKTGCGMTEGEPLALLRRTLGGYARHANFSAVVVLGLGCEVNQIGGLMEEQKLAGRLRNMDIQTIGGTRKTVEAGVAFVREALHRRQHASSAKPVPASELTSRCNAAARTAIPASPPIRRSAPRATGRCATAAPSSSRKRRRPTAPNIC